MKPTDEVLFEHILEAANTAVEYLGQADIAELKTDPRTRDAIVLQIQIIGEAASRLSDVAKDNYPTVSWVDIIGMRHKLVHDYFGVDIETVWKVVNEDIPELISILARSES